MLTVRHGLFSLILVFSGLRIESLPLSIVQGKCICTTFKAEIQEIELPLLCTKPSKNKHTFLSFKDW